MKRLFLVGAAVLLVGGALAPKPVWACPINQVCTASTCNSSCVAKGFEGGICATACVCRCLS